MLPKNRTDTLPLLPWTRLPPPPGEGSTGSEVPGQWTAVSSCNVDTNSIFKKHNKCLGKSHCLTSLQNLLVSGLAALGVWVSSCVLPFRWVACCWVKVPGASHPVIRSSTCCHICWSCSSQPGSCTVSATCSGPWGRLVLLGSPSRWIQVLQCCECLQYAGTWAHVQGPALPAAQVLLLEAVWLHCLSPSSLATRRHALLEYPDGCVQSLASQRFTKI